MVDIIAKAEDEQIKEEFPDETLMAVSFQDEVYAWFTSMANFKAMGQASEGMKLHKRKRFFREATRYVRHDPILFCITDHNLLR